MSENRFKPGHDYRAGEYSATGTVASDRINLFHVTADGGHHIGTLVSGSKTKIERFERDAARICDGLAALDDPKTAAAAEMLEALRPFAALAVARDENDPGMPDELTIAAYVSELRGPVVRVTLGDCRRALGIVTNAEGRS